MAERRTLPRWARWTAVGCSVAVLGAGTYLVVDALPSQAATSGLRTATVTTGSVTQSTSLAGSVERVDQVTAAFRTAGTVTSVEVAVGDEVDAGDVLATIDTADLTRAVTVAQANLVAAQAALDAADSSSSSSSTSSASPAGSGSTPTTSAGAGSGSGPTPSAAPSASPSAPPPAKGVDTTPVHRAVDEFDALVEAAVTTCRPVVGAGTPPDPDPTPTPTPTPSEATSPTPSPSPSQTPTGEPSATASPSNAASPDDDTAALTTAPLTTEVSDTPTPEQVSACIQALSSALASAQHTASAMDRLVVALDAAAKALQEQQSTAATQGTSGQSTATGAASGSLVTGTGSSGGVGGAGGSQSAASLEVDVLEATQELAGAEQDLAGAVLRAPISGRVGQVDLVKGEQASTSSGVVLVGPGAAVVTVDLPLAQLGRVRVGQDVEVTPAGTTTQVAGLVQSIGVLPSSTTTTTPTYPVRVTVSDAPVTLAAGSTATVTITLATATDVLTVPVSAVSGVSSASGSVQVLSGGVVTATPVTVGAVGQGLVQVEAGLTAGQVVVLADPSTALPSSSSGTLRRSTTTGVSSLTGNTGPGGGPGGPPPG